MAHFLPDTHDPLLVSVTAGDDPDLPHRGRLSVGDWTVPCVIGRNGLVEPHRKREGDGATPIGVYPLRYGFYDPHVFEDAPRGFAFPFVPKPQAYDWVEDPDSIHYNRLRITANADRPDATQEGLFDLFVPIGWNDASPRAGAGSAIFLHAARPDMRGTRGCVAIPHDRLLDLARRLRPGMMISIQRSDCRPLHALLDEAEGLESVSFQALEPGPRVIVLGGVTLLTNDPRFMFAKPAIGHFAIGLIMLKRGWMLRYVPPIVSETIPEYVTAAGYAWAALMFALGLGTVAMAMNGDIKLWVLYITVVAGGAKVAAFALQFVAFRFVVANRLRAARA